MKLRAPLAERMRPQRLEQVLGQEHLLGADGPLRMLLEGGSIPSMVFWGPPGVGKTTLARLIADHVDAQFLTLSAVLAGVKDIRQAVASAQAEAQGLTARPTVLFIDEVHRFNKSQQDALLPYVEDGTLVLVGATTENPSFELNGALLSRLRVFVLRAISSVALEALLLRALTDESAGLGQAADTFPAHWLKRIAEAADGDARKALTLLDTAVELARSDSDRSDSLLDKLIGRGMRRFDKQGENFYDQISALHKSVRGSDPDAAVYWFSRMIDGGCDPRYIARRVTRMAYEDVGLAEPGAIRLCLDAWDAYERLGSPEGELALAQAVIYLAGVPKSNAAYVAYQRAGQAVEAHGTLDVPMHLRNAPTRLMKDLDYGAGYRYDHDEADAHAGGQQYLPEALQGSVFYEPTRRGIEGRIAERLEKLAAKGKTA